MTRAPAPTGSRGGATDPGFCAACGRPGGECGGCGRELDPPRFCGDCGRRMAVMVTPTGYVARCRDHGVEGPG